MGCFAGSAPSLLLTEVVKRSDANLRAFHEVGMNEPSDNARYRCCSTPVFLG
jgi:hypothetical protein